jgi:TonB family protein
VQSNQDHLRFRRRAIETPGESQPKSRFVAILTIATAAVILPAMIYGLMHSSAVSMTVRRMARHVTLPVKEMRVAIIAARPSAQPSASPTPSPSPTPQSPAAKAHALALAAHQAHLRRLHARALALASSHAKKVALAEQTSDVGGSQPSTANEMETTTDSTAAPESDSNAASSVAAVTPTATPSPATVAAAQEEQQAQQPEADATPVYAPDVVVDARFTHQVQPEYPAIAKDQGATGTAVVLATIGPDGKVISAKIDQSTGNRMLDEAALDAAKASGFEPPIINGKPATETYRLVYNFTL